MADKTPGGGGKKPQQHGSPLRLIYDNCYVYIGFWRYPAHCWLRVYVSDNAGDVPIVIATELPDNEGTSITNFVEKLAWQVMEDKTVWALAPNAAREGVTWIEHHPTEYDEHGKMAFPETFSIVTFSYSPEAEADADTLGTLHVVKTDPDTGDIASMQSFPVKPPSEMPRGSHFGEPEWQRITRAQVERMIGQPFPEVKGSD